MWKYDYKKGLKERLFNKLTVEIVEKHCLEYKSTLEIGCGTAQLSKLLRDRYPEGESFMVDSSISACNYVKDYFYDNHYSFNIQLCDIFLMKYNRKFDITMSSGFIEHFIGEQQKSLCDIHKKYSKKYIICVVPFADKKCIEFFKSAECKRRYGFQKPLNAMELRKCFEDDKWKEIHSEVYYERNPLLIGIYRRR